MKKIIFIIISVIILTGCDFLFPKKVEEFFTVNVTADSGVIVSPIKAMVQKGENAVFTYTLKEGYVLNSIIVDGVSITPSSNSFTLTNIGSDMKVYVTTKEKPKFIISANAGPNGRVTPSGNITITEGQDQTFSIVANPGFLQDILKVNDVIIPSVSSYTFSNVTSNAKLDVTFKKDSLLWPLLHIEWKQDSVYMDQYKWPETIPTTLNYYSDGTFTRLRNGILNSPENYVLDKSKSPATITFGGIPCKIEELNENRYVISYINSSNQYVRLIFKNNKYK